MHDLARRRALCQELDRLPEQYTGEILNGRLSKRLRGAPAYSMAVSHLRASLGRASRSSSELAGWVVLGRLALHIHDGDVLIPDASAWRRARMPSLPRGQQFFDLVPDWVGEVIAASDEGRTQKLEIYASERVGHVWLVDPLVHTLEVLALDGETYRLVGTWRDAARVRAVPFDAIELELDALWAE